MEIGSSVGSYLTILQGKTAAYVSICVCVCM